MADRISEHGSAAGKWPKILPPLTDEQQAIYDDFMERWHKVLPRRYTLIERFNHSFPIRHSNAGFRTTIEIGAGLGEHLRYESLSPEQEAGYSVVEIRENMAAQLSQAYPHISVILGDCQDRLPFPDGHFDRYMAIHVLEHLPNLPACLREAWRLLDKHRGQLLVVIPCEGSPAYSLARRVSAQRMFERTYGLPHGPFIQREHINLPAEILAELDPYFVLDTRSFFPLPFVPVTTVNLCLGLALRPRPAP